MILNKLGAQTPKFKDVFSEYIEWEEFTKEMQLFDHTKPENITFNMYIFGLIYRMFSNSQIRYTTIANFKNALANVINNKFSQYLMQYNLINDIYKITLEEIAILQKSVFNNAENPNTIIDDPTKPISFISSQQYNQLQDNRFRAYVNALNNIPTFNVFTFLRGAPDSKDLEFIDLFKQILTEEITIYDNK